MIRIQNFRKQNVALAFAALLLSACMVSPEPLSVAELEKSANINAARATHGQEPVTNSISLYEAMARALKYNLDHRIQIMQSALSDKKLSSARANMLPNLVAELNRTNRSERSYSYSDSLNGTRSSIPSTSSESATLKRDITFSWNILDFGLSYVRAKQEADKSLIAEEQRRKVINRIIEDVRTAYWRAVSAERLLNGFSRLEQRIEIVLSNSRQLGNSGYTSPIAQLTFQRELVEIKGKAQRLQRELTTSKIQLAALMNLSPSENYHLVVPKRRLSDLSIQIPSDEMIRIALQNRPEIREASYYSRISKREAEVAILELLPGVQLFSSSNFDASDLLLNNNWVSIGAKASWNVMKLFKYPIRKGLVEADIKLKDQRALAMTMAVMTQVEVAIVRYKYLRREAKTAQQYNSLQQKILRRVKASAKAGVTSEQNLIQEELSALIASAKYDIAYADLQNAFATIYASIGVDPWGDGLDVDLDVATLSAGLKKTWQERGDVGE